LLLCADTRNQDATLLCTYMCTHGGHGLQAAWTCGLVAERQSAPVVRGLCAVGVPPFQKQRRALASLLTPEQLQLHAQAHDNRQLTIDHHHCARDTLAAHAGATTLCFCAVLFCHCVDTCKHNARRNARFAERAAPSCCSIHNGRPARPSGLPI
jgi:hypothetical protein